MRRPPTPLSSLSPALGVLALASAFVLGLAVAGAAAAQPAAAAPAAGEEGAPPLFVERLDVNVVNVEVFVTDRQGRRVTGLEKEDFEILQDGKPVEITNFFFVAQPNRVDAELARGADAGEERTMTPPSELPEEQQLNLVVYVDHFNLNPQNRKRALEELEGFLEDRMFQGDRVMLMGYDGQVSVAQTFTRDWQQVRDGLRALGRVKAMRPQNDSERRQVLANIRFGKQHDDPYMAYAFLRTYVQQQKVELRRSTAALESTVRAMAGLPGRKALFYVSDGLPQRPGEELYQYLVDVFNDGFESSGALQAPTEAEEATIEAIGEDEGKLFNRVTRAANANQVTFYTVDARGGTGERLFGADSDSTTIAGGGRVALEAIRTINMQEPLIEMAEATGGASILNTFELADAFHRTGVDFDNFYSLGFRSPARGDGEFHDVEVRVKRPGLRARHRRGFVDKPQEERVADRTLSSLVFKMESNPLGIEVDFGRPERQGRRAYEVPVLVRIPFRDVTLLPNGEMQEGRLRIYLVVEDEKGGVSELHQFPYPVQVPNAQIAEARGKDIGFGRVLRLAPGTPRVAVGVWDELSGTESFVHKQVRVTERPGGAR